MAIDLDDPIALMLAAAAALRRSGAEYAAYGGLALGMYGSRAKHGMPISPSPPSTSEARGLPSPISAWTSSSRSEDFVILKLLATRERDLEDARGVVETQRARLDTSLIQSEIDQLIAEIPDHDIRGRFATLSIATG